MRNLVSRNRVFDHNRTGIGLVPFLEEDPQRRPAHARGVEHAVRRAEEPGAGDAERRPALDAYENEVTGNVVTDSREADLAVASAGEDIATFRNCFAGNEFATSAPLDLQALAPCEATSSGGDWTGDLTVARWVGEMASLPVRSTGRRRRCPSWAPTRTCPIRRRHRPGLRSTCRWRSTSMRSPFLDAPK